MKTVRNKKQNPLIEEIENMRIKLRRFEAESKSLRENAERYRDEAISKVASLRSEIAVLRMELNEISDSSNLIMDQAFQKHKDNLVKMANLPANRAVLEMDYEVSSKLKTLDALRYKTTVKRQKLAEMEMEYNTTKKQVIDGSRIIDDGNNELVQNIRLLENNLDKTKAKIVEMIHIKHAYEALQDRLLTDSSTYTLTLETMAAEVRQYSAKLAALKEGYAEAVLLRDQTLADLRRQEQVNFAYQERMEIELFNMKRSLDLLREEPIPTKNLGMDDDLEKSDDIEERSTKNTIASEGPASRLMALEKIHFELKEATGESDHSEMENVFNMLDGFTKKLRSLSKQAETRIELLLAENEELNEILQQLQTASDPDLSQNTNFKRESARSVKLRKDLDSVKREYIRLRNLLTKVHLAVESIYVKLQMVPSTFKGVGKRSAIFLRYLTEIHLPDLMTECLDYQDQLENDLDEYDLDDEFAKLNEEENMKLMPSDALYRLIENRIPPFNKRINVSWNEKSWMDSDERDKEWRSMNDGSVYSLM